MDGEAVSELIFDQGLGLYYPAVTDYYGYYYTGSEPLSEWDSNHQFFGQDPHISAVQTDSLQNVYYFPSYGYVQSPYNPYNPSIPGAVIGTEASFLETHYPTTNPSHQLVVSSPAYIPRGIDPNLDSVPNAYLNPLSTTTGVLPAAKTDGETKKLATNSFQSSSIQSHMIPLPKEAPFTSTVPAAKQPSVFRVDSQGANQLSNLKAPSVYCSAKGNGYPNYGSELNQWAAGDNKFRPRLQINGTWASNRGGSLPEQNRGPRSDVAKCQWVSPLRVKAYTTRAGAVDAEGNIIISADHFNRDDFLIDFPDAKFFVIKSYSEDDVHKSIKYNVWSSTPSGNKRLDNAFDEAMKLSLGRVQRCPVFFFFSVNASGQFCGVAEMTGPVDFQKDMDFWQQDKWLGSFPVRWHIVKDVSNTVLRHILLENNEYKPVTCSRDTQEIPYVQGIALLHLFKAASLETSILDDFLHYEERQRILFEEKSRVSGRRLLINNNISNSSNNAQILSSALVPSSRRADDAAVEKEASGAAAELDGREELPPHSPPACDAKVKAAVWSAEGGGSGGPPKAGPPTNLVILGRSKEQLDGGDGGNSIMKIASLLIDPKADEDPTIHSQNDIITVGSMRIKVGQIVGALPADDQGGL